MAALGDEDVPRLDVPINDAFGVGGVERSAIAMARESLILKSSGLPAI